MHSLMWWTMSSRRFGTPAMASMIDISGKPSCTVIHGWAATSRSVSSGLDASTWPGDKATSRGSLSNVAGVPVRGRGSRDRAVGEDEIVVTGKGRDAVLGDVLVRERQAGLGGFSRRVTPSTTTTGRRASSASSPPFLTPPKTSASSWTRSVATPADHRPEPARRLAQRAAAAALAAPGTSSEHRRFHSSEAAVDATPRQTSGSSPAARAVLSASVMRNGVTPKAMACWAPRCRSMASHTVPAR